jgi:hypothetical protein
MAKKTLEQYKAEYERLDTVQQIIEHARENSKKIKWIYNTEKIEYFLNGEMLLYQNKQGKWFPIRGGVALPGIPEGVTEDSVLNYPKDPHILTLSNGTTAKALGNPLIPQAKPFSNNDDDVEAAKKVTNGLMYYRTVFREDRQTESKSMRDEIIDLFKYTGCAFIKDYFDPNAGDMVPAVDGQGVQVIDPKTGMPAMKRRGDLRSEVVSGREVGVPNGIAKFSDIPWIVHEKAMHVNKIFEKYGVWVEPDDDLGDDRDQTAWADSNEGEGKSLADHARVYEVYLRPSPKYPKGRMVAGTKEVKLFDGIYDKMLADSDYLENDWHPFSFAGWKYSPRKFWPKTPFEDIVPHQINLNKLWQGLLEDDKNFKGWWLNAKGSVDWEMVRESFSTDGYPNIQYDPDLGSEPKFVPPPRVNSDKIAKINLCVARMNDIMSQFETTRGNSDPNITSGKQADVMQNAANSQSTPLLTAIVSLYVAHWTKVTHLMAVHFNDGDRDIRFEDPNSGEIVSDTFTADDIKSDDITLFGGNAFFMSREEYNAELDRLQQMGVFGDAKGIRNYLRLRNSFIPEDSWNPDFKDIDMAKWENNRFKQGFFKEDRGFVIGAVNEQYTQEFEAWKMAKEQYPIMMTEWEAASSKFDKVNIPYQEAMIEYQQGVENGTQGKHPGEPPMPPGDMPMDPGEAPTPPEPWWRALHHENAQAHIEEHESFMKSVTYYKLCKQFPELNDAMTFHILDHIRKEVEYQKIKQDIVMAIMPPPMPPGAAEQQPM